MNENLLYNLNIERGILSYILFQPEILNEIATKITPNHFYLPFHKALFASMIELDTTGKPIDEEFLKIELTKKGEYDEIALLDVISATPLTDVTSYINDTIDRYNKREIDKLTFTIKKQLADSNNSADDILLTIGKKIESVEEQTLSVEVGIDGIIDNVLANIQHARENQGVIKGFHFGLMGLEKRQVVGKPGEVGIIGGNTNMGKTGLMLTVVAKNINRREKTLISSLDMGADLMVLRLVSVLTENRLTDMLKGIIKHQKQFDNAIENIKKYVEIHDEKGIQWDAVVSKSKKYFRQNPDVNLWVVDTMDELVSNIEPVKIRFELGRITSGAKAIGAKYNLFPILLIQLASKKIEARTNKRPMLSDIQESSRVAQASSIVLLVHRESYYTRNSGEEENAVTEASIFIAKNQSGQTGVINLTWDGNHTRFMDFPIKFEDKDDNKSFDASALIDL